MSPSALDEPQLVKSVVCYEVAECCVKDCSTHCQLRALERADSQINHKSDTPTHRAAETRKSKNLPIHEHDLQANELLRRFKWKNPFQIYGTVLDTEAGQRILFKPNQRIQLSLAKGP